MMDADIIVVGAGIIGSACASRLAQDGYRVLLVDDCQASATAAGMGHLVCMDDHPAELALCSYSLQLWHQLLPRLPASCTARTCGTLWLAEQEDEMTMALTKQQRLQKQGVISQLLSRRQLHSLEPLLTPSLAGGLRVSSDSMVYAPAVARWLADTPGITLHYASVTAIESGRVWLSAGQSLSAPAILLANGLQANALLGQPLLQAKKGQLAITDRYPPAIRHQLVELGYGASAHLRQGSSVAFNLQARPGGQLLIGSSRQYNCSDTCIDGGLLAQMLQRAQQFVPQLEQMTIIRCWSGLRAASADGLPLLGEHPTHAGVWLALGHEGLGVTTAPATAMILSALIQGHTPPLSAEAFAPRRLWSHQEVRHA